MSSVIRISPVFDRPIVPFPWPMSTFDNERALVIDDDPDLRPVFRAVIHRLDRNLRLDWANGVHEALARLRRQDYKFVIADYLLGDGSGLVIKRWVDQFAPDLPFGMISAIPLSRELEAGERGVVPFLAKPFSTDALRAFMAKLH